jgi:hypothetical protein
MASAFHNHTLHTTGSTPTTTDTSALKVLTLSKNQISWSDETGRSFSHVLRQLSHLWKVWTCPGIVCTVMILKSCSCIRYAPCGYWLFGTINSGPCSGLAIRDILVHCRSLQELNLRNNFLEDDGAWTHSLWRMTKQMTH